MSRRAHYGEFYEGAADDGRPLGVVHGNCQAEALRVLLAASTTLPWRLVRVPPVHELGEDDLPCLDRLLARCTLLLSQPVREGYRGLPLGTAEVATRMPAGAQVLRWPVVRWTGLHPWQAIVRLPDGAEPPVVPYHDLRTLTGREPVRPDLPAAAEQSRAELARREQRDADVGVSDLLVGLGLEAAHTVNHPGSALLRALAHRLQEALGCPPDAPDPARALLGGIRAPLEPVVLTAMGLPASAARDHWLVHGEAVPAERVVRAQRQWYAERPDAAAAGLARHAPRLAALGLS